MFQDTESENWWLQIQNEIMGYWPGSIFTHLQEGLDRIDWGGKISNSNPYNRPTSTQMGSGHFPSEGFKRACYIKNLAYVDNHGALKDPEKLIPLATNPSCYDISIRDRDPHFGYHCYFGGPGYN